MQRMTRVGPRGVLLGASTVARNKALQVRFGFDNWHVRAAYHLKPYKQQIVRAVNAGQPHTVIEVGCGLGDVISRVRAPVRIGVDADAAVVSAARVLHRRVEFLTGSVESLDATLPKEVARIDALVMVNWPHLLPSSTLVRAITTLMESRGMGLLFIDGIHPQVKGYAHHHGIKELSAIGEVVGVRRDIDPVRDLYVVRPAAPGRLSS